MWQSSSEECDNLNSESRPVVYSLLATNSVPIVDDKSTWDKSTLSMKTLLFLLIINLSSPFPIPSSPSASFMMTREHHEVHTFHVHQVQHLSSPFSQQLSKSDYRQSSRRTWRKRRRTRNAAKTRWEKIIMKIEKWEYEWAGGNKDDYEDCKRRIWNNYTNLFLKSNYSTVRIIFFSLIHNL